MDRSPNQHHRHLRGPARRLSGSSDTETATVDGANTTFTHLNAEGDTRYEYQVRSVFSAGNTAWVGPAQAIWIIAPVPPTSVTAAIDGNDILVSWTRPKSNFIHEFQVHTRPNR